MVHKPLRRLLTQSMVLVSALAIGIALADPSLRAAPPRATQALPVPPTIGPETPVSTIPTLLPEFDGPVWTIAADGPIVYLGGQFGHAIVGLERIPRGGLAAVDVSSGRLLDWAPTTDGVVTALAVHAGGVFIGGEFDFVNGLPQDSLALLDGRTGALRPGWNHLISGYPSTLAVGHGRLYVGGSISQVGNHERQGLVAFDLTTGAVDPAWAPAADARVEAMVVTADQVYLAGKFHWINKVTGTGRVAAVDPVAGAVELGFHAEDGVERAFAIAVTPEGVFVGHGGLGGRVRAYDHTGRTRWELSTDGDVKAVAVSNGIVYFGGHFDRACRTSPPFYFGTCHDGLTQRIKLGAARVRDGNLLPWQADGNGVVGIRTLAASPARGELLVGGEFTTINEAVHRRFARFGP